MFSSSDFLIPVEDGGTPSRHADGLKGLTEVDSGFIFNLVGVELMESQVQTRQGKKTLSALVSRQTITRQSSPVMCMCVCARTHACVCVCEPG